MYLSESLQKKWEGVLDHPDLPKIEDKYKKVARYAEGIISDVETIAHSVGVSEPRKLRRHHVRIVGDAGKSEPLGDVLAR